MADAPVPVPPPARGTFTEGSTLRHVLVMAITGSVGLMAIFLVDFLSLLFVSWLGDERLTAGVGFATIVLFLLTSANIGLMIATTALTAKRIGAGDREGARSTAAACVVLSLATAGALTLLLLPFIDKVLAMLGASGLAKDVARSFLLITLPSNLAMALGMAFSGVLRAVGDARRAMYVTLAGGLVTAGLDPLLIFGLGLGTDGAAWATAASRLVFAAVGFHGAVHVHDMVGRLRLADAARRAPALLAVAGPAILTNIATPLSSALVARIVADLGAWAIAASAVIDRLSPVAFGALFALSGAIGPILAQNWGAARHDRMRLALRDAFLVCVVYVGVAWAMLILLRDPIIAIFALAGPAAEGVRAFIWLAGPMWLGLGMLFTANASFNNLGFPLYATAFNWGRATLGTVPLAWLGTLWGGYTGALVGITAGALLFGAGAAWSAWRTIAILERRGRPTRIAPENAPA